MKIKNRLFYEFPVVLASPLSISGGDGEITDHDVLLDDNGKPFITGASITGALRSYKDDESLWGFTKGENGRSSRILVSDIVFDNAVISVRDGIALDENKVTKDTGKYDYQVVETGATGVLKIEVVLYDKDVDADEVNTYILELISAMHNGLIRFGFKKTRGLGEIKLNKNEKKELKYRYKNIDLSDISVGEYIKFLNERNYNEVSFSETEISSDNSIIITADLELKGGLSIRTYSAKPNEADFMQITLKNNTPVIPGSTWNGAIRSRAISILEEIGGSHLKAELEEAWGIASEKDEKGNEKYTVSDIVISESQLEKSEMIRMTRNKINRFDASTVDSALYTERSAFGGLTNLMIQIKKEHSIIQKDEKGKEVVVEKKSNLWVAGLIMLVLEDLGNGLLAVGGQTAVGRGIFGGSYSTENADDYKNALAEKLKEVTA